MSEPTTVIGEQTSVQGNLQGDEDLTVLGQVEGSIELDHTLTIEAGGVVKADVKVCNAIISGVLLGNVQATQSIHITADGRVVGDIAAPRIIIVDGAMFRGRVDMGDGDGEAPKKKVEKPKGTGRTAPTAGRSKRW